MVRPRKPLAVGHGHRQTARVPADRPFDVLLLGGASGAGKSMISYPLARRYGVALVEVDDIVEAVKRLTTPGTHPWLHYWDTHPQAATLAPDRIVEVQVALARSLAPGVTAVISNHLETGTPVVIEGDYLLPSAAAGFDAGRVRSVLVHEPEVDQYLANYAAREPHLGEQRGRAEASVAYGRWLADEAERHRVPVVAARPWATGVDRIIAALDRAP